jgi:hypothetical protein
MATKRKRLALMSRSELIEFLQAELGVKAWTVQTWIRQGKLPAPAVDTSAKSRWWRRAEIETWLYGKQAA